MRDKIWIGIEGGSAAGHSQHTKRVTHRVIAHETIRINGKRYKAERMRGSFEVVFRETKSGARHIFNLDYLAKRFAAKL